MTRADLVAEAANWRAPASEIDAALEALADALDIVEGPYDDRLVTRLQRRTAALLDGRAAGAHAPLPEPS